MKSPNGSIVTKPRSKLNSLSRLVIAAYIGYNAYAFLNINAHVHRIEKGARPTEVFEYLEDQIWKWKERSLLYKALNIGEIAGYKLQREIYHEKLKNNPTHPSPTLPQIYMT